MEAALQVSSYEEILMNIVRLLPAERVIKIVDYARYIQSQTYTCELEHRNESKNYSELQNSKALLNSLLNSMYDIVFFKDINGVYLGCNKSFADHVGRSVEDIVGKTDYDLYTKEEADAFRLNDKKMLESMTPRHNEEWISYPDGRRIMIDTLKTPLFDSKGKLIGITGVSRDITEHGRIKEIQEFLAQTNSGTTSESFFETLAIYLAKTLDMDFVCIDRLEGDGLNATTLAVWSYGKFEDNITYALKDTPCGEVVGKTVCCFPTSVTQFFPKDQVLQELKAESYVGVTLFSHTGKPIGLIAVIGSKPLKDKNIAESVLKMVAVRASGELERLEAEAALIESERNYRQVINTMQESLSVIDSNGNFLFASQKAAKRIAQGLPEDMVGKSIRDFVPPEQAEKLIEQYKKVISDKEPIQQEVMLSIGEKNRWFINTLQPIEFGSKKKSAVLSMSLEITRHKQAEADKEQLQQQLFQAQKLESIGRLAGGVAHDLNNMLSVIIGNVEMAIDELEPYEPAFNELQEIRKAAERSANLTRQLLAFARKQIVAPKILDLNATIADMLKMLTRIIGEDIDLKWQPQDNLWQIKIDPSQIDQILANLCVNARDAISDVGKITIETGMKTFDKAYCDQHAGFLIGEYAMLAVSDNGCGMDKETMKNIFEPFFTTKESGKGTGLGLAMVYGIIKQNKGFINVYSELNKGTTFKIYFPRYKDESTPLIKENIKDVVEYRSETILLVEDEAPILTLTKMMLEKIGYKVLASSTPKEAIKLAQTYSDKIDLLITDVVMPDMNGKDLAKNILSIYPDIKVLFMSGYTANVIAHHGVLDSGVNFIQKPFSKQDLSEKIRNALAKI
ncbi:MAG: PAS domain-containing protein [Desulfamplus sp.]|nr:PAS domain-containing protein [Desulfamplus sp.]